MLNDTDYPPGSEPDPGLAASLQLALDALGAAIENNLETAKELGVGNPTAAAAPDADPGGLEYWTLAQQQRWAQSWLADIIRQQGCEHLDGDGSLVELIAIIIRG